jgi:hypothetical protein
MVGSNGVITGVVMPSGGTRYTLDSTLTAESDVQVKDGVSVTGIGDARWTNSNGDSVDAIYEELRKQANDVIPPEGDDNPGDDTSGDTDFSGAYRIGMLVDVGGTEYSVIMDPHSTTATGIDRKWSGFDGYQYWDISASNTEESKWYLDTSYNGDMLETMQPAKAINPWEGVWTSSAEITIKSMTPIAITEQ